MKDENKDLLKQSITVINRGLIDYYANVPSVTAKGVIMVNGKVYSALQLLQSYQTKMDEIRSTLDDLIKISTSEDR
jgi:hypothetical protein